MVDIIHRVGIKAPVDKAYAAVAITEDAAGWWTKDTIGTSKINGTIEFRFYADGGKIMGEMHATAKKLL